jgi:hypothetical protein
MGRACFKARTQNDEMTNGHCGVCGSCSKYGHRARGDGALAAGVKAPQAAADPARRSYFTVFQYSSKNPMASTVPAGAPVAALAPMQCQE